MLIAISAASVLLVNKARDDSALVVHTLEVESQISLVQLLRSRRAESAQRAPTSLTSRAAILWPITSRAGNILPCRRIDNLAKLISDNPVQGRELSPS